MWFAAPGWPWYNRRQSIGGNTSVQLVLFIVQIILALTLIGLVLLQSKNMGSPAVFGGSDSFRASRRGLERTIFNLTAIVSGLFFVVSLIVVIIS